MNKIISKLIIPQDPQLFKKVLHLAWPIILGNLSRVMMGLVDMAMVGHLGAPALAATGMGAMLFWVVLSFVIGIRTATQTVAARRLGQKKPNECGSAFHNGLLMALMYSLPISIAGYFLAPQFVPFFLDDIRAVGACIDYTGIVFMSLIFSSLGFVFQGFFMGIERTRIHMNVTVTSNVLNVYLNAGLIYGSDGIREFFSAKSTLLEPLSIFWGWYEFPALGVKGAALATLLASAWLALHYTFYLLPAEVRKKYGSGRVRIKKEMLKTQIRLAFPQGSQEMIVAIGWSFFYKIMALIGLVQLAATEVVFTVMHASFMPALGVGQACSTLVSKHMGEKRISRAEKSIVESLRLSEFIMGTMGMVFIIFPHQILPLFTTDPAVREYGVVALRIIGLIQFIDAVGFTLWFALSGAGNTFYPAVVESGLVWLFLLPLSYLTGVVLDMGFLGPWIILPVYIFLFAAIMAWKILQGDWKEIQV